MFEGLTNKGREYMAKCLAQNKPISFTKVKIGNGNIGLEENPETFIDIKSIKKEVNIVDKTQVGDRVKLLIQIDNTGVLEGYFPREIGIYVSDGGQEILYWYINDGSETSWLPPASKSPVKFKYHINLMVTNLETVIINWSGKELWVDREFLNQEMAKKLNNGNVSTEYNTAEKIEKKIKEIDTKFKNLSLVPVPVGGVLAMYNNTNPAELYSGTTWELVTSDKYIRTGNTALQTGGSNSISIGKENLPNIKLQVESFQLGRGTQEITGAHQSGTDSVIPEGAFYMPSPSRVEPGQGAYRNSYRVAFQASRSWTGMSTAANPYTEVLGSGTALSIQPAYITLKFWKRLS